MKTLSLAVLMSLSISFQATADTLTLLVDTPSGKGQIRAAVFASQAGFDAGELVAFGAADAGDAVTSLTITDLKPGRYGIALFNDLNGNEELDRNLLGAPSEPIGFSNNPKIGFSAPKFDAFGFEFEGAPLELNISLIGG